MATVLDTGILNYFSPIFTFLLVLVVSYALLAKTQKFGSSVKINFTLAMTLAFVVLFTGSATKLINYMTPWFVVLFILIALLFMILTYMGYTDRDISPKLGGVTGMIIVFLLIIVIAVGNVFGPVFSPYDESGDVDDDTYGENKTKTELFKTIFSPRLLSAVFILLVAAIAIHQISQKVKTEK